MFDLERSPSPWKICKPLTLHCPLYWQCRKPLAPLLAGFILALTHNYTLLYFAAAAFVLLGILTVLPIKAVR